MNEHRLLNENINARHHLLLYQVFVRESLEVPKVTQTLTLILAAYHNITTQLKPLMKTSHTLVARQIQKSIVNGPRNSVIAS